MKIIDKNTDFYDFYQNIYKDDALRFDRTDSFLLTKEELCHYLYTEDYSRRWHKKSENRKDYNFLLLQIGVTYWLFLVEILKANEWGSVSDYNMELLTSWKDYEKGNTLVGFETITFSYGIKGQLTTSGWFWHDGYDKQRIYDKIDVITNAIKTKDYETVHCFSEYSFYKGGIGGEKITKHIPLFKACGIQNCVDPYTMYEAFEEHFSLLKTASERTDALGTTNTDKIRNHGFDVKKSFRGKP